MFQPSCTLIMRGLVAWGTLSAMPQRFSSLLPSSAQARVCKGNVIRKQLNRQLEKPIKAQRFDHDSVYHLVNRTHMANHGVKSPAVDDLKMMDFPSLGR